MRNPSQIEFASARGDEEDRPAQRAQTVETAEVQSDAMSAAESIKNNVSGIDTNLIKLLEMIEIQSRVKIDQYEELINTFKHDKKFMKKLFARIKYNENKRREARQAAAKEREEQLNEERRLKNIEKMKKKENITGDFNKKIMYRSPPPPVRVFKKKVIQTKEEAAFLMYLGAEFDLNEE